MPTQAEIIDALHFDLQYWTNQPTSAGDPAYQMTYKFETSQPSDLWDTYSNWSPLSAAEKAAYRAALDHVETLINVEFVEHDNALHGTDPTLNVGIVDIPGNFTGYGGMYYYASGGNLTKYDGYTVFETNNLANEPYLILHEIGHALANDHPFDGAASLPLAYDNSKYTLMSYDANPDNGLYSDAMQVFDILALQARWGANTTHENGNTSYTGNRTNTVDSIWDAGGTDTFDANGRLNDVDFDLREGTFSSFDDVNDVSIAYGVVIENATGGAGDDTIKGNDGENLLKGRAGADVIRAEKGADTLKGDKGRDKLFGDNGADTLNGGKGKDTLTGGNGGDTFVFTDGFGKDTIKDFLSGPDMLEMGMTGINSMSDLQAIATQDGNHLVLDFVGKDILTLRNSIFDDLTDAVLFV